MKWCNGFEGLGLTAYRVRITRRMRRGVSQVCWNANSLYSWSHDFCFRRFEEDFLLCLGFRGYF
jgi:hypothetical protein